MDEDLEKLEHKLAQLKEAVEGFERELAALKRKQQSGTDFEFQRNSWDEAEDEPGVDRPERSSAGAKAVDESRDEPAEPDDQRQSANVYSQSASQRASQSTLPTAFPTPSQASSAEEATTGPLPPGDTDTTSQQDEAVKSEDREQLFLYAVFREFAGRALSRLLGPVADAVDRLIGLYRYYQQQGKAPVFLMTVVGLIALTTGFGYGLQYTFTNVLSDALKVVLGFIVGVGVIGLGCFISLRKPGYQEYGASVIGLGIVFNYLCAYFVGPYFGIVSEPFSFTLLALITAASYALTLLFETRIVACVTLVGGVFSPVLLGNVSSVDTIYVNYLLVLAGANLHLSRKIQWPVLAQLSYLLSLGMLEYSSYASGVGGIAALALHLAFFNLFAYYWSFDGLALRESLSRTDLGVLTTNVFYMLYAVLSATVDPVVCAVALSLNAGVIAFLVRSLRLSASIAGPMYTLMIASLVAGAIFVLAPLDIMGALWAAEGLTLLYVGFRYRQGLIRIEGYAIFAIAIACLLWQTAVIMSPLSYGTLDAYLAAIASGVWPWLDLAALGGLFFAAYRTIGMYSHEANETERRFEWILNETFTFWAVIAQLVVVGVFLTDGILVLAVVPLLWCFYRTARHELVFAPVLGYLLFTAPVLQILLGMSESESRVISYQPWLSWVAMVEFLLLGWGIQWCYEAGDIDQRGDWFARLLRTAVSLTPAVVLVSSIIYIYETNVLLQRPAGFDGPWLDVTLMAFLVVLGKFGFTKAVERDVRGGQLQLHIVEESISATVSVLFLYSLYVLMADWALLLGAIPFAALLYRGVARQLPVTELIAWSYTVFPATLVVSGVTAARSFDIADQTTITNCAFLVSLLSAWLAQWVYQQAGDDGYLSRVAVLTRTLAYLLIPLLFLPTVEQRYPEFLALALWCSFLICWLMHRYLDIRSLLVELRILFAVAGLAAVYSSVSAIVGAPPAPALLTIVASVLVLLAMHWVEGSLSSKRPIESDYRHLFWMSVHYFGFCLSALLYALTDHLPVTVLIAGLYYVVVSYMAILQPVTKPSLSVSHKLAFLFLGLGPIMVLLGIWADTWLGFAVMSVVALGSMVHVRSTHNRVLLKKLGGPTVQFWLFHAIVVTCYWGIANILFEDWSVLTTIALLLHAVVILFLTLRPRFKPLLKLSLLLYGLTTLKLLILDLDDASTLVRVGALMAIGLILMVAAYYYQKVSERQGIATEMAAS